MPSLPPLHIGKIGKAGIQSSRFSVPGLFPALWLDASDADTITHSAGSVSQWNDKSGNGNHLTQATASYQPITGTQTINGRNVLAFSGDKMFGDVSLGANKSIFVVGMIPSIGADGQAIIEPYYGDRFAALVFPDGKVQLHDGSANTLLPAGTYTAGNDFVFFTRLNGTALTLLMDDVKQDSAIAIQDPTSKVVIGDDSTSGNAFDIYYGEIIAFDRALSDVEANRLGRYLQGKWGTPWTDV